MGCSGEPRLPCEFSIRPAVHLSLHAATLYDQLRFRTTGRGLTKAAIGVLIGTGLCGAGMVCGVALGQDDGVAAAEVEAPLAVEEEIIVRGRSRALLRVELERAEEAFYARFNEINSDDELDIHCRRQMITGSNIPRRTCAPNFWRGAQASSGEETVRALQGGFAMPAAQFLADGLRKYRILDAEMRRLATEDEQLTRAVVRVVNLSEALRDDESSRAALATTSAQEAAGEAALPYDAALRTNVRIGREPWRHTLTQHAFAIAHVFGDVQRVEVRCGGRRTQRLEYELGVEWTLPEDWTDCNLLVEAPPGTTFSLYEFE